MIEKTIEMNFLYDYYGALLPEKQQEILRLYYEEDYSLSEIAPVFSMSRQGIHDAIKKAEKSLHEYEDRLGLVKRSTQVAETLEAVSMELEQILTDGALETGVTQRLIQINRTIKQIREDQ